MNSLIYRTMIINHQSFVRSVEGDRLEETKSWLNIHPEFLNFPDDHGRSLLHIAAVSGSKMVAEWLIRSRSVSIDFRNQIGQTPLHFAAGIGHKSMVKLLIRSGSTIDLPDKDGWTPLHLAAWAGHESTIELLVRFSSSSLDSSEEGGMTPLTCALFEGYGSIVRTLKAVGASHDYNLELSPEEIQMLEEPIPEEEILKIRNRIYFKPSLVSRCLFHVKF